MTFLEFANPERHTKWLKNSRPNVCAGVYRVASFVWYFAHVDNKDPLTGDVDWKAGVNVPTTWLNQETGSSATSAKVLKTCLANGILEKTSDKYSVGRFAKSYRFTPDFLTDYLSEKVKIKRFGKKKSEKSPNAGLNNAQRAYRASVEEAYHFDEGWMKGVVQHFRDKKPTKGDEIYKRFLLIQKHFMTFGKTGRCFTFLSFIPAELRKHIRYRGQECLNVDIANCQMSYLGFLSADTDFLGLALAGQTYDSFANWIAGLSVRDRGVIDYFVAGSGREQAKQLLISYIFGQSVRTNPAIGWAADWMRQYPTLLAWMEEQRRGLSADAKRSIIPSLAQKIEADAVVTLAMKHGYLSLHDGLWVPASDAENIKTELSQAIYNQTNLNFTIKIKSK